MPGDTAPKTADEYFDELDLAPPCGDKLISTVIHENGTRYYFCILDAAGVTAYGEHAPPGAPSLLTTTHDETCAADVWRMVAPASEVPAELDAACTRTGDSPDVDWETKSHGSRPNPATWDYCSGGGVGLANWVNTWHPFYIDWQFHYAYNDQAHWVIETLWGWHDRSMTGTSPLSEEANIGEETIAACSGTVRFRAWWRWDAGDSWIISVDQNVGSGGRFTWNISYTGGSEDIDVRFRSDSVTGVHRHAGVFLDN